MVSIVGIISVSPSFGLGPSLIYSLFIVKFNLIPKICAGKGTNQFTLLRKLGSRSAGNPLATP